MTHIFRPHGDFITHVDGQIVVSEITGPWNKELVQAWAKHIYPYAKQLGENGPYVGVAVISESMLCPADALDELRWAIQYGIEKLHCVANIIVAGRTVEGRDLVEPAFARVYEGVCPHRFFYTYDEAREWANALLSAEALKTGNRT